MKKIILMLLFFISFTSHAQWVQVNNGLGNIVVNSFASIGIYLLAGTGGNGVFLTTNNGTNWIQTSLNNQFVKLLAVNGSDIFSGTTNNDVYLSTNNASSWVQTSLNNQSVYSIAV